MYTNALRILALTFILVGLAECSSESELNDKSNNTYPNGPTLDKEKRAVLESLHDFEISLTNAVASNGEQKSGNFCISPIGAVMAVSMYCNILDQEAQNETASLLYGGDDNIEGLNPLMEKIMTELPHSVMGSQISISNSIWINDDVTLLESSENNLRNFFKAYCGQGDLSKESGLALMNQWISDATDGKIDNFNFSKTVKRYVSFINALLFEADWHKPFDPKETSLCQFTNLDGSTTDVEMMKNSVSVEYVMIDGGEIIELEYSNNRIKMVLFLPSANRTEEINDFTKLNADYLEDLRYGKTLLRLPKYKIAIKVDLSPALEFLGFNKLFKSASISGLTFKIPSTDINIGFEQLLKFEVNEKGTEMSSATAADGKVNSNKIPGILPEEITFDRPFQFRIEAYGINIAEGRVTGF